MRSALVPTKIIRRTIAQLSPTDREIGWINLILPTDAAETGGHKLLGWLTHMAPAKMFSLTTMPGDITAAEAIAAAEAEALAPVGNA